MEAFAAHYFESNVGLPTGVAANADAACVLSYSTIMLNTDLHSTQVRSACARWLIQLLIDSQLHRNFFHRQVKRKMTLDEFKRNNRGTNNKLDWPSEYLTDIYNSIAADAIKMTDRWGWSCGWHPVQVSSPVALSSCCSDCTLHPRLSPQIPQCFTRGAED